MRFYYNSPTASSTASLSEVVTVRQSNASFPYGFEYLGVAERLVQTPLTDRTYFTLTQALFSRMAGNPFGTPPLLHLPQSPPVVHLLSCRTGWNG